MEDTNKESKVINRKKDTIVALSVYGAVLVFYILGLKLPDGKTHMENILSQFHLSPYVTGYEIYLPGLLVIVSTILGFVGLKTYFKHRLTLWINGIFVLILAIVLVWKLIY